MEGEEVEPRVIKTIPISSQKSSKMKTDPKFLIDKELYRSNSANDLLDIKENKRKIKSEKSKKKKHPFLQRTTSARTYFDHYNYKNCEHCPGLDNILKKDKSKLSSFIEKNPSFLKLFGNPRYNKSSPFLFVEDHKNRIDDDRIGLLPIPSKPKIIMKSKDEKNRLYEIQRKVVMMRRFQYGKRNLSEPNYLKNSLYYDYEDDLDNIILIQKMFRGYIVRKKVEYILNFKDIINKWQQIFDKLKAKKYLRILVNYEPNIMEKVCNIKGYNFITKIRRNYSSSVDKIKKNYEYKNKNRKN